MIYTPMTLRAMCLAFDAHRGQVDKAGAPYILHPVHLVEQMPDETSCVVALLHDVVEDTNVTMARIEMDYPPEVARAVALLTHDPAVDYFDYVRAIRANPLAAMVKRADLRHNSEPARMALSRMAEDRKRALRERYARALEILNEPCE